MAPKRRRDAVAREITKTYTFGRSQIDKTDVDSLVKNRMVGAGRAPDRETVPRPRDNEVVIFRDLLYAGLRFPLHPAVVDILRYFDIYLHQLTPNAILRLSAHQVHHQRRTIFEEEGDQSVEKDCQFGCLNFSYKSGVVSPVTAYRNKWPSDWQQHWFYYAVSPLLPEGLTPWLRRSCHPFTSLTRRTLRAPKAMSS
jgi:hypothetical protein